MYNNDHKKHLGKIRSKYIYTETNNNWCDHLSDKGKGKYIRNFFQYIHNYLNIFCLPSHIGLNKSLVGLWIKQPCREPGLWYWGPFWPLCSQLSRSTATFCLHCHPPLFHESSCLSKVGCISSVCLFSHCCSVDAYSPCWRWASLLFKYIHNWQCDIA